MCQPELKRIVNIARIEQERDHQPPVPVPSAPICVNMTSEDDESETRNEERWSDIEHRVQRCTTACLR